MKKCAVALCLVLAAAFTACSSIMVKTDYDQEVDFSVYQTYSWIQHRKQSTNRMMKDPLIRKHIMSAVERELEEKGLRRVETESADLLVAFHIGSRKKVDVTHYHYRYGRWGHRRGHDVMVHKYREGTLILDFVDRGDKELIWRGWASGVLHGRENIAEDIDNSVQKVLEKYPPR
ncbi:MAG: DUF4136 domain-containing protein [Candidatus Krumholzibacteriota bacterium]|nr:DUF4136 domain-containing protein [Candidatus Krumholzibacteriota bacterium]